MLEEQGLSSRIAADADSAFADSMPAAYREAFTPEQVREQMPAEELDRRQRHQDLLAGRGSPHDRIAGDDDPFRKLRLDGKEQPARPRGAHPLARRGGGGGAGRRFGQPGRSR